MRIKLLYFAALASVFVGCNDESSYKYFSGAYSSGEIIHLSKSKLSNTRAEAIKNFLNLDFTPKADDSFYADPIDADINKDDQTVDITKIKWKKANRSCIYSLNGEDIDKNSIEAQKDIPSLYTIYVDSNGNTKLINCSINNNYKNSNIDYNDMQIWSVESDGDIISNYFSKYSDSSNKWIEEEATISKDAFAYSW